MPALSPQEKIARIEMAYKEGKITKAAYETNLANFRKEIEMQGGTVKETPPQSQASVKQEPAITMKEERKPAEPVAPNVSKQCLSCGHDIGDKKECPHCSAKQYGRITEKQLIAVSCVLLLLGAVFVGAAGVYSDTKITMVSELSEPDNYRHIRVVGKVMDTPDFYPEKYESAGSFRILVNDGTGDIWIKTTVDVGAKIIEDNRIPGFGDTLDCEGSLYVGEDNYFQIKVRDADLFRIVERTYLEMTIEELLLSDRNEYELGALVSVNGQIQGKYHMEGFAWILDLADEQGRSISVFMPESIPLLTEEFDINAVYLSKVNVKGALQWYSRDQVWEIIPVSSRDITVLEPYTGDTYTTVTVSELLANITAYNGTFVQMDNVSVVWTYADYLFSISDFASANLEITIFVDYDANASTAIKLGDKMSCRGWVSYYDSNKNGIIEIDEWEIKVRALSSDYALRLSEMGGVA